MTAYTRVWPEGWRDNEDGGTYLDANGLNHMEDGIAAATNAVTQAENRIVELNTQDATNLSSARSYSDANLATAKSYTDTTASELRNLIAARLSSTYKAGGSVAFADLPALAEANLGLVVNLTEAFTTTSDFVEGAGKSYPAGTNVVVVLIGASYQYDILAGFVDLSDYAKTANVNSALSGKVDKVSGKGLSTNDYTTAEKTKLAGIAANATANTGTITGVTMNGVSKGTSGVVNLWTVITAHQDISGKVDKVSGKGLSTNDYTTAEKTKLADIEAGAQVNEVTAEQHNANIAKINALKIENASLKKRLENLLAGLEIPVYRSISGTGVIDIPDSATGPIMSITVSKSLAGQTLYVQRTGTNGLTDVSGVIDSDGVAAVSLATTKGGCRLYITTGNYTFPPSGNGHGSHTGGTYINLHTDENGRRAYDAWIPNGGVEATVRYIRDAELGENVDKEISWEDFLSMVGLGVNYVQAESVAAAITAKNAGKEIYAKIDGYPFGTQAKPTYSQCDPSQGTCLVYYIAEYYRLTS